MRVPRSFFVSDDCLQIAVALLGKILCVQADGLIKRAMITETEAYLGPEDKASHAFNNRRTKRTETMFQNGGTAYVYLCYGIHRMMNIVTNKEGIPHAILIRAGMPLEGIEMIADERKLKLLSGPGKFCKGMNIGLDFDNEDLVTSNRIWLEEGSRQKFEVIKSPRVGIAYAKEFCNKPWRYRIKDHASTSKPKNVKYE